MVERRAIPGYEGYYEASSDGRIYSVDRVIEQRRKGWSPRRLKGRELSYQLNERGYLVVTLTRDNITKGRSKRVHRLVLMAFQPTAGMDELQVNHLDGNPANNRLENLEWCDRSHNITHSYRQLGRKSWPKGRRGKDWPLSKPVEGVDPATGSVVVRFDSTRCAARDGGYTESGIYKVLKGIMHTHKGLAWRYPVSSPA